LKQTLAEYAGVSADAVIVGNGSNEMLLVLLIGLANHEYNVIICQPTFTIYNLLASGLGRKPSSVFLNQDMTYNSDQILDTSRQYPKSLLILCSPNNPTGTALTEEMAWKILETHTGFVILDQAYVEFGGFNALPLLKEYPNLIITRTFSKACSGAGLRLGYMLGAPEVLLELNKIKLPYNINFFSLHAAQMILSHRKKIEQTVAYIKAEREKVFAALKSLPLENVYPSAANFICVRCSSKNALFEYMRDKGDILLRDVSSYPLLENCLRISIGTAQENEKMIDCMKSFFNKR
jgi:histidinol-phosphate aminotransferase